MSESERGAIFLFGSQKGGVGKTTCATNFAVYLARKEADIVLVDADPQNNSMFWAQRRHALIEDGADLPPVHCVQKTDDIKSTVLELAKKYDAVIIDASGRDSRALRTGLMACDVAYIPCQASAFDLETMDHMKEVLNDTYDFNPTRVVRSLITQAPTNPMMDDENEARSFLADYTDVMPLSRHRTRYRSAYKKAALQGLGVQELTDTKARAEIDFIGDEIVRMAVEEEAVA